MPAHKRHRPGFNVSTAGNNTFGNDRVSIFVTAEKAVGGDEVPGFRGLQHHSEVTPVHLGVKIVFCSLD